MKKKILYVCNVDWFFISHRLPIAIAAQNSGLEVHVACHLTNKVKDLELLGFTVHKLDIQRSGTSIIHELKTLFSLFNIVKNISPDLMHVITIKPVLYAGLIARILSIPTVASVSGLGFVFIAEGFKNSVLRYCVTKFYRLSLNSPYTKVIFQNATDLDLFLLNGITSLSRSIIIRGSGVDLQLYNVSREPDGDPIVILLARLLLDKGVNEFVEAAKILKEKGVNCTLVLAGDIDDNPKSLTKHQIEQWVSNRLIEYWGFSSDVNQTYSKCHIAVLPSYREGLPKSLIEAAACGRAVVTTDVPGCRDAIIPNKTGLLVPVKNSLALAEAIEKLCVDENLRREFGKFGRQLAEEAFDIQSVIRIHLNLYNEMSEIK